MKLATFPGVDQDNAEFRRQAAKPGASFSSARERIRRHQPITPFSPPRVWPPALSTTFIQKANSKEFPLALITGGGDSANLMKIRATLLLGAALAALSATASAALMT
jgi:hypothetical protein